MKKKIIYISLSILFGLVITFGPACKRDEGSQSQTLEKSSISLLSLIKNDRTHTIFYKALQTVNLDGPLGIYGNMTLLAPTDDAFQKYFKRKGITDLSKLNADTLKSLLKYHIYNEQYASSYFVAGTLPTPTINGNYIRFDISAGLSQTKLNGTATFDKLDIIASNGVMHSLNDVLEPPTQNLYDWLKNKPEYSLILEAFDQTGNSTELLKKIQLDSTALRYGQFPVKWKTVFLETNNVFKAAGINSFDELAKKYSNHYNTTKAYTDAADSLNIFVRFHVLGEKYFVSDFSNTFKESIASGNYLIFNSTGGIYINKHTDELTGQELKVGLDVPNSNYLTTNGIVNTVTAVIAPYKVKPITVIQPFCGNPSDRTVYLPGGVISDFATQFPKYANDPQNQALLFKWIKWGYPVGTSATSGDKGEWAGDICVNLPGTTQGFWIELTTPLVFAGNYNVYINYTGMRRNTPSQPSYTSFNFDGKQLGSVVTLNLTDAVDAVGGSTVGPTIPGVTNYYNDNQYRRFLGKVSLTKASTHIFRLDYLPSTNPQLMFWYNIELVPVP